MIFLIIDVTVLGVFLQESFTVFRHGLHGLHGFFFREMIIALLENRFTYISTLNPCNPCLIY